MATSRQYCNALLGSEEEAPKTNSQSSDPGYANVDARTSNGSQLSISFVTTREDVSFPEYNRFIYAGEHDTNDC